MKTYSDLNKLNVSIICPTISGELGMIPIGSPITLIRLQGCNLSCDYCDAHESKKGKEMTVEKVITEIKSTGHRSVLITGGEPLLQRESVIELIRKLTLSESESQNSFLVQVETNGTCLIPKPELLGDRKRVSFVVDFKHFFFENIRFSDILKINIAMMSENDWLKFVIPIWPEGSMKGYLKKISRLLENLENWICDINIAISAIMYDSEESNKKKLILLAKELISDRWKKLRDLKVCLNIQSHKLLGIY